MQPPDQPKPSFDQPENSGQPGSFDREPDTSSVAQPQADPAAPSTFSSAESTSASTLSPSEPASTAEPMSTSEPTPPTAEPSASAPVTPVAPAPMPQPLSSVNPSPSPQPVAPKKSKKPLLIAIVILILALIGGGVAAGLSWYQDPDKVVTDSIVNSFTTEQSIMTGEFNLSNKDVALKLSVDTKSIKKEGTVAAALTLKMKEGELADEEFKVNLDGVIVENGDTYIKFSNLEKTVDAAIDAVIDSQVESYKAMGYTMTDQQIAQMRTEAKSQFSGVITKLDNQWIKASAEELNEDNDDTTTCILNAVEKMTTDKNVAGEVLDVYEDNRFIVVKETLGTKDGSFGYLLSLNKDTAKGFGKSIENTTFGKDLIKCDADIFKDSESTVDSSENGLKDVRFELWVDQWSHKITRIVFNGKVESDSSLDFSSDLKFDYETKVEPPKAPEGAKSIEELQSDIEGILNPAATISSQT